MTLAIVLLLVVLIGFVLIGYSMNKGRNVNKDDAMRSGRHVRHEMRNESKL